MKKIILLTTALIVVATIILTIKKQSSTSPARTERESKNEAGANGMIEYFAKIMNDPATGQLNLNAFYGAMAQFNQANLSRATNSTPLQWQFKGPDNIGGRTRAILFDKKNPGRVFAAGVSGGLWISNNGGHSWAEWSGSDQLASMNIVSICQDAAGNVYFGTGEGLYANYGIFGGGFPGAGMWKSPDTGSIQSLQFTRLTSTIPTLYDPANSNPWSEINRITANPLSADSLFAATQGGVMFTANGGTTWAKVPTITLPISAEDVKYSIDGKKIYAAQGGNFYYSNNGGKSFTNISGKNGFPSASGIERIEIAVSPTTPNYAYAVLVKSSDLSVASVVQTTNAGASWTVIGVGTGYSGSPYSLTGFDPTGDQGDYDVATAVSPIDSNTVFVGGITLWRWTSSAGWLQISDYGIDEFNTSLHSDIHALVFDPTNSSRLVIGCDGGVNQTLDPYNANANGVLYSTLDSAYNVTQYYNMSADSFGHVLGGAQDNGNDFVNYLGNTPLSANIVIGGDGACTQIALSNNQAYFAEIALGDIERSSNGGGTFDNFADSILNNQIGKVVGSGFFTPFDLWENLDSIAVDNKDVPKKPVQSLMAVGINGGEVWVTPDALNFGVSPNWYELQNITGDITAVKFSNGGKFLYVGTDAGLLYRFSGFDSIFKNKEGRDEWVYPQVNNKTEWVWNAADSGIHVVKSTYSGFNGRSILSIAVDPNDSNHVIATCGNYVGSAAYVAISNNATDTGATTGFTFTLAQGSGATALPNAPVYASCITHSGSLILVGTPVGVWSSSNDGATWAPNNNGLANVTVMSIKEHPYYTTGWALYAGTHGRGMWVSYTLDPNEQTSINNVKGQTVNGLTVFPNPMTNTGHIQYTLAKSGNVTINLYDIEGKLIKVIANENMIAGPVDIQFNVADLVSGTYIIQVVQGQNQATQKLVVLH